MTNFVMPCSSTRDSTDNFKRKGIFKMNFHSAMRFLKKTPWLFEWFYAKLSLNDTAAGTLQNDVSGTVNSISASFDWTVPPSGFLLLRNSSAQRETVPYSSFTENNGVYTFTVDYELQKSYESGDFCAAGSSLIDDWNIYLYTGTGWNELYSSIPELTTPALVVSPGNASYYGSDSRNTSVDILVLASDTVLFDSPAMEAQKMLDKVLEILDWARDGKLLCVAKSHQLVDFDAINIIAYKANFDLAECVRSK